MAWAFDDVVQIPTAAGHVAVHRRLAPGLPVALMTHGTGFCASVWGGVAERLSDRFQLYAIDRRGHGASSAPDDAYDFTDFAADAVVVIDHLQLRGAYGVGHSAGATDLLLAAAARPEAFARLWVMEPTAMDPAEPGVRAELGPAHETVLGEFARRRATFASRREVLDRYTGRGVFAGWRPDLLDAYVRDGFADQPDGTVTLCCTPEHETSMLRRIFAAMEGTYAADADSGTHPFSALSRVPCPVRLATTEHSQPIYRQMADVVDRLVPHTSRVHFDGLGHAAPQVDPGRVADDVLQFWAARPGVRTR